MKLDVHFTKKKKRKKEIMCESGGTTRSLIFSIKTSFSKCFTIILIEIYFADFF